MLIGEYPATITPRQNGPDLRRDYDSSYFSDKAYYAHVRMDLIYEGITTEVLRWYYREIAKGQNGPDLRRDYDDYHLSGISS